MPKPAITRVPNLAITPVSTNKNNGLYAPQLTTAQITAIPAATAVNGGIVFNTTTGQFQVYQNNAWANLTATGITAVAANYTVLITDVIVAVTIGGANKDITLPAIGTVPIGKIFTIKDASGGAAGNRIRVISAANIDGAGNIDIGVNYGFLSVYSNGTTWFSTARYIA